MMSEAVAQTVVQMRASKPQATALGLFLALGVPLLLLPTGLLRHTLGLVAPQGGAALAGLREAFFWALTLSVLLVLRFGEGLRLADIGWRTPRWTTVLFGGLAFVAIYALQPVGVLLLRSVGGAMPTNSIQRLIGVPVWLLALTVVRAAVCEEVLFRGYGTERLTALTGSRLIGIVAPALVFMAAHIDAFGVTYVMFLIPVTTVLTGLYAWRRDLWANILAHFLTDGVSVAMFAVFLHPR